MSDALSNYLENALIDHIFRTATFSKPAGLWIAAYTVAPSDTGGGTEVTGGAYARVNYGAPADAKWAAPSSGNGTTSNLSAITFPTPTADWGTLVALGVLDASTAGNLLIYGALSVSKTVHNGDAAPSFAIGACKFILA